VAKTIQTVSPADLTNEQLAEIAEGVLNRPGPWGDVEEARSVILELCIRLGWKVSCTFQLVANGSGD